MVATKPKTDLEHHESGEDEGDQPINERPVIDNKGAEEEEDMGEEREELRRHGREPPLSAKGKITREQENAHEL